MAKESERPENPINQDEKDRQAQEPKRVLPDLETDSFGPEEQKKIVQMVMDDAEIGKSAQQEWLEKKRIDVMHLNSEKPSIIEGLAKKAWMADRNLGLAAGVCDIYQATLLATCYNPDSIHFKDTERNDVNNKDNLERFTKWALGESEAKFFPEVDDFISNKIGLGFSAFKVFWESKYRWVDKRIPIPAKDGSRKITGYKIETEKRLFERGVIKNIDEIDNILLPTYGKNLQETAFLIERIWPTFDELEDMADRKIITNFSPSDKKFTGLGPPDANKLRAEDEKSLGIMPVVASVASSQADKRSTPIEIYEWYGNYEKSGKKEQYRFWVEPKTWTFLGGKPLRKINRTGKRPYVGGPLRRRPGFVRGGSLISLIAPVINAINNAFNQIADFQYFENVPEKFYDKSSGEGIDSAMENAEAGKWTGVSGDPNKIIYKDRGQRSMAWGYQFIEFLMQVLERLTGAASYFLTSDAKDATATRDNIVEEKGQVKFGLWVKRIQSEISEAVNMFVQQYQDWAPPNLGRRVLGEDGKAIIKNLSINSLCGMYDAYMVPDITSGSKAYERQVSLWAFQALQTGSVWFDPRMNARGNWLLTKDVMKKQGFQNPEHYLPPQPKEQGNYNKEAEEHFNLLMQGDIPEPPGPDNPQIVECLGTFLRLKETRYQDLDKEYRQNFDDYMFKAYKNYQAFMTKIAQEQLVMRVASMAAGNLEKMGFGPQGAPQAGAGGARPAAGPAAPPLASNGAKPGIPGMGY